MDKRAMYQVDCLIADTRQFLATLEAVRRGFEDVVEDDIDRMDDAAMDRLIHDVMARDGIKVQIRHR